MATENTKDNVEDQTDDTIAETTAKVEEVKLSDNNENGTEETESESTKEGENPEFEIKHPLQNRWTLWYDHPPEKTDQSSWDKHLKKVVTFDTVEDFWRIFNNIRPASRLTHGSNYHLFKGDIAPKWEHPDNAKGGKWIITCKGRGELLDKMWLWSVLACIGENFDDENEINGCVVSIRKGQDRLALWTRTSSNEAAQRRIGQQLKKALEMPDNSVVGYTVHADSLKGNSSYRNRPRYEV
eukprot:TRINITY_DN1346_c0_g1_i1.p1 TRINITY_DN1346_c0_g1~~TRINITY_DN1346_c0_g1_i1.p1  ORF type:complete len:240 (-),score=37.65 TRINITY_DN1346_c0_g1_i1:155-874(-)